MEPSNTMCVSDLLIGSGRWISHTHIPGALAWANRDERGCAFSDAQ